ncbi:hypothetical protein, partial [Streptomyces sp. NPDC048623]|uniref:hypothetical protein n=1 Tax=Streptomyces sp. NPDC048623 TaxID=3155761 RepID=UPI00344077A0
MRPIISRKILTTVAATGILSLTGGFGLAINSVAATGDQSGTDPGHHAQLPVPGNVCGDHAGLGDLGAKVADICREAVESAFKGGGNDGAEPGSGSGPGPDGHGDGHGDGYGEGAGYGEGGKPPTTPSNHHPHPTPTSHKPHPTTAPHKPHPTTTPHKPHPTPTSDHTDGPEDCAYGETGPGCGSDHPTKPPTTPPTTTPPTTPGCEYGETGPGCETDHPTTPPPT